MKKFFNYQTIFIAILAIVFLLHLPGLFYNFPLKNTVGDEVTTMGAIFKMLNDHSLRPAYQSFYHLPVAAFAQLPFYVALLLFLKFSGLIMSWAALKQFVILDYGWFLPFARLLAALFAVGDGYLMYRLAARIFNSKKIALLASFLLSFNLMFFQVTHFARVWSLQILLLLLAVYVYYGFFVREHNRPRDYWLVSLATALAFGVHLASALVYLVFLVLYFFKYSLKDFFSWRAGWWSRYHHFIYLQFYIIGWLLLWYYLNPTGFLIYLQQPGIESVSRDWTWGSNLTFYSQVLVSYDWLLVVAAVPGFILLWQKYRTLSLALLSFIIVWIGTIAYAIHSEPRFVIAVVPFLILPASYGLVWLADKLSKPWQRRLWYSGIAAIVIYLPLLWTVNILRPSTLLAARQWIFRNVPANAVILVGNPYLDLPENKAAADYMMNASALTATTERRFISAVDSADLLQPRYFVLATQDLNGAATNFKDQWSKVQYVVVSFWNKAERERVWRNAAGLNLSLLQTYYPLLPVSDITDIANNMLRPYWTLNKIKMTGPFVEIYRVN